MRGRACPGGPGYRCHVADQFDSLSPRDVVITIRSLGRRFGEISGAARSDPAVFDQLDAAGPHGRSLPDIVIAAAQAMSFLGNEIDRVIDRNDAVVPRAVVDPDERTFTEAPGRATMADAVDAITAEATRIADRLDRLDAKAWGREAELTGGGRIQLMELAREAARTEIRELREAEVQLEFLQDTVPGAKDPNADWDGTEPA
jgi:hypothetical protein